MGACARPGEGTILPEELAKVIAARGRLPVATALRQRIRHFSDGAVLCSKLFVSQHLSDYRARTGRRKNTPPVPLPDLAEWGVALTTLRGLRRAAFG
ncbi:MAG: hypothetical protein EAZ36_02005 [Verrucomicrobia bacterium]|nr:MAG: hypothetical protein EAZ36_02005 [Verrucomicrobiota bacterium]